MSLFSFLENICKIEKVAKSWDIQYCENALITTQCLPQLLNLLFQLLGRFGPIFRLDYFNFRLYVYILGHSVTYLLLLAVNNAERSQDSPSGTDAVAAPSFS